MGIRRRTPEQAAEIQKASHVARRVIDVVSDLELEGILEVGFESYRDRHGLRALVAYLDAWSQKALLAAGPDDD